MKTAVIILGHGSRNAGADEAIRKAVDGVKRSGAFTVVEHAFLQYVAPSPQAALESCIRQKAGSILIVPFFLQAGAHVTRDIPVLVENARKQHPGIKISVTDYVGTHPLMAKIVEELVKQQSGSM